MLLASGVLSGILLSSAGAIEFTKITEGDWVNDLGGSRSVNWIDHDGDGDLDLYVTNGGVPGENNYFYVNDGGTYTANTISEIANDAGRSVGSTWGDFDNDGDPDLYVVTWYLEKNPFFVNNGDGTFTRNDASAPSIPSTYSEAASFADPDNDGDLDLFLANSGNASAQSNMYFENNGDGSFTRIFGEPFVTEQRYSRNPSWADYDGDGDLDLFVANEGNQDNLLFRNQLVETGTATLDTVVGEVLVADGGASFSGSWADYDDDGDWDLFVANSSNQQNALYQNQLTQSGTANFVKITDSGATNEAKYSVSGIWGDCDNDGDQDLFVTNGWHPNGSTQWTNDLYINDGDGTFTKQVIGSVVTDPGWSYGQSMNDIDGDGDLDIFVANWFDDSQNNALYRNDSDQRGNHWLIVELTGTTSNRSGIGAVVRVETVIGDEPKSQQRLVQGQDGYCSQNLRPHFGLGNATSIDLLTVKWPSGIVQVLIDVPADQVLEIEEPAPTSVESVPGNKPVHIAALHPNHPNPFHDQTTLRYSLALDAEVGLRIFDASGKQIRELVEGRSSAGTHSSEWDGRDGSGNIVSSGLYFARLQVQGTGETHELRITIVK